MKGKLGVFMKITVNIFISHMVQMKVINEEIALLTDPRYTFISHMVQMKAISAIFILPACFFTLYPTWFRWKTIAESAYRLR